MSDCSCEDIIIKISEEGIDGNGIVGIELISTVGLVKTYRITMTNGMTFDYEVADGSSIASISKTATDVLTDTYTITLTNGSTTTFEVVNGRGITKITYQSSSGLVDTYKITYNDGTTSTFTVTNGMPCTHSWNGTTLTITSASGTSSANLKGEKGDAATITVGTVTTGAEGTNANVTNVGTSKDAKFNFTIPRGNTGNGISKIELQSTSGLDKTYRITYTNGSHFDFVVHDGNGIASVELLSTSGATDTYRITFTDGTHFDYNVVNGSDEWGAIVGDLEDQEDLIGELWLFQDSIEGTVQDVTFGLDGKPSAITHKRNGNTLRTDSFVWGTNSVTETRTLADGRYITIGTDLATLVTTISEIQEGA